MTAASQSQTTVTDLANKAWDVRVASTVLSTFAFLLNPEADGVRCCGEASADDVKMSVFFLTTELDEKTEDLRNAALKFYEEDLEV